MLKLPETLIKPKFLGKKIAKILSFLEKTAKKWTFPQFSLKTLKYDKIYPNELRSRLYEVLNIKRKAQNALKLTETSKKSKFLEKICKNLKFLEKNCRSLIILANELLLLI